MCIYPSSRKTPTNASHIAFSKSNTMQLGIVRALSLSCYSWSLGSNIEYEAIVIKPPV